MSEPIDKARRTIVKTGILFGIGFLISPISIADELNDLADSLSEKNEQFIAVRVWPSSVYTRITVEAGYSIKAKSSLKNDILLIDFENSKLNSIIQSMPAKVVNEDPIVKRIDVSQFDGTTVRLTVLLKQSIRTQMQTIAPVNLGSVSYQFRYVLDMYPMPIHPTEDTSLNDDILALLQLNSDAPETPTIKASSPITAPEFLKKPKIKSGKLLIMLDPGHGGEDPGAIGPTGVQEKSVVLDISKKLYDIINQSDYLNAELTRSQDIFIPLGTRVAIARRAKADIFLSIHADAFTTPNAKGASVFILSDSGASSSFAKWLAQTQNNADLIGGMSFKSKDKATSKVLLDMTQTWTSKRSSKLGQLLLPKLAEIGQLHNGKVEKAAFAVLKAPDIPSVLVETAFISNPEEEQLLNQSDYRQKIAQMIFDGVSSFIKRG